MKLPLISAGEFFELLRPAAYALSALLSIWVLASACRRGFKLYAALAWALGTFLLPYIILPLYLILLIFRTVAQHRRRTSEDDTATNAQPPALPIKHKFLFPIVYGLALLAATGIYLYRDYNSVDAHLARAAQAKLKSQSAKTIREYRGALSLEENPHTHKLLGVELAEAGQWADALQEFRLAEQGGEPDELLPFRLAQSSEATQRLDQAVIEYRRFLNGDACAQAVPDQRCIDAKQRVDELEKHRK